MKFEILDVIELTADHSQENLKKGSIGIIVFGFYEPVEAYEVEFINDNGLIKKQLVLLPAQIKKHEY